MRLKFIRLTLGPLPNNVYLLGDDETGDAVVIDPSFESRVVLAKAEKLGWTLRQVWLTHGHFDHMAGVAEIANAFDPMLPIGLHPGDQGWYERAGGAAVFGLSIAQPPPPTILFKKGMSLSLSAEGDPVVTVRHAPGHSQGHVMFYCQGLKVLFCGDVIFRGGIGRTDLEGGDLVTLLKSIQEEVFTLPDETRLLSGHGLESTVGYERVHNPFL
jgi:glyoxylase-like metal-dependent hydrolase (beta-lactamase superfamily II)